MLLSSPFDDRREVINWLGNQSTIQNETHPILRFKSGTAVMRITPSPSSPLLKSAPLASKVQSLQHNTALFASNVRGSLTG